MGWIFFIYNISIVGYNRYISAGDIFHHSQGGRTGIDKNTVPIFHQAGRIPGYPLSAELLLIFSKIGSSQRIVISG